MAVPVAIARLLGAGVLSNWAVNRLVGAGLDEAIDEEGEIYIPVSSTAIRAIGYSAKDATITVEFRERGTYEYPGSLELFLAFVAAPSKGGFFNSQIRPR